MCTIQEAGTIELYFYGELDRDERARIDEHLRSCRTCADALHELKVISAALASRPDVSGPPSGDWSGFMQRLDRALGAERIAATVVPLTPRVAPQRRPLVSLLATAALLTIVTAAVFVASRAGRNSTADNSVQPVETVGRTTTAEEMVAVTAGLNSVGLRHLERSKLVVLGLAAKEAADVPASDWAYERELATSLLKDTRLYRLAAEERGLMSLAGVMRDLELVLLQASMAQESDATALPQIQRLIRKRGLVQKMDVVGNTGLLP